MRVTKQKKCNETTFFDYTFVPTLKKKSLFTPLV